MKGKDKLYDIDEVERLGNQYLKDAEMLFQQGEIEDLEEYKQLLTDFVSSLRKIWFRRGRIEKLVPKRQELLRRLASRLSDLEIRIASQIIIARRDLELLEEMDRLAFPQDIEVSETRDFSGWSKSPLYFPGDFMKDLALARIPGGR